MGQIEQLQTGQLQIIDSLYASVADPARWSEVVHVAARTFGGELTVIHRVEGPPITQRLLATIMDPAFAQSYEAYYGAINPWAVAATAGRSPIHINDGSVEAAEVDSSEFRADWLRPMGDLRYPFNLSVRIAHDESIELATIRPRKSGPFTPSEHETLKAIYPHLERAVELSRRLSIADARKAASTWACHASGAGLILIDSQRCVHFIDEEAERILGAGGLTLRNGRIAAPAPFDARFDEAVALATGEGRRVAARSGLLLSLPRSKGRSLSVAIGPVDERDQPPGLIGPLAMILVSDPERGGPPSPDALRARFAMSSAEARLVAALCTGKTLAAYAVEAGVSPAIANTLLKQVFAKTGDAHRDDLVRRVLGGWSEQFPAGRPS